MRVFLDRTVPAAKRDAVREAVAIGLLPALRVHPQFADLAVLVSRDARRGGWQVDVVVLDPALSPTGTALAVDPGILDELRESLRRL